MKRRNFLAGCLCLPLLPLLPRRRQRVRERRQRRRAARQMCEQTTTTNHSREVFWVRVVRNKNGDALVPKEMKNPIQLV